MTGGGLNYQNNNLTFNYRGLGEIEIYFPQTDTLDSRMVYRAALREGGITPEIKYLYIRPNMKKGHFTAGRQPVFWSYGAIFNLMDYGPAIDQLAGQTIRSGIDGLRYHRHLGSGNSLQLVATFPKFQNIHGEDLGYGSRLRFPGSGYDLSFNFFYQPVNLQSDDNLLRSGLTFNTDISGPGIYGSGGYFHLKDSGIYDLLLQMGIDYSWILSGPGGTRVIFQTEYFRFLKENMNAGLLSYLMLGGDSLEYSLTAGGEYGGQVQALRTLTSSDLLLINISFQPHYFSTGGSVFMYETENKTGGVSPYYITELGQGLELRFENNIFWDAGGNFSLGFSGTFYHYF